MTTVNRELPKVGHRIDGFECIDAFEFAAGAKLPFVRYRSRDTSLTVAVVGVCGPAVKSYIAVPTEAHTHDGIPHVLEHMVFLGSEDYQYKGLLDMLANRCFAQGTNAWTERDHTCYTLTTIGAEGMLRMLPVYLEHVLYASLSSAGFLTEIHHITGSGEDAGVVYNEMLGRENTADDSVDSRLDELLFSVSEDCGYGFNTGGRVENLRTLSVEKVRDFHRHFYRPENICLIVVGDIAPADVIAAIRPIEAKIIAKKAASDAAAAAAWERPWKRPVPSLQCSVDDEVLFPADESEDAEEAEDQQNAEEAEAEHQTNDGDEEAQDAEEQDAEEGGDSGGDGSGGEGQVFIGWRGCAFDDYETQTALDILMRYLTESAVSPLRKALVEGELHCEQTCADLSYNAYTYAQTAILLYLRGVPPSKLSSARENLFAVLRAIAAADESDTETAIDMRRMRSVIRRTRVQFLNDLEADPHDTIAYWLINDFTYAADDIANLRRGIDEPARLEALEHKDAAYWRALLAEYLIEKPYVAVVGRPSSKLAETLAANESARIAAQIEQLGPQKLAELDSELEAAVAEANRQPPSQLFEQFPVPDVAKIPFIDVQNYRNVDNFTSADFPAQIIRSDQSLPFFIQLSHVRSAFIEIRCLFDTSQLPARNADDLLNANLRYYLPLLEDLLFEGPIRKADGTLLSHEEVVYALNNETVEHDFSYSRNDLSQMACLNIKVERTAYENAIQWIADLLFHTVFSVERIRIAASKLLSNVSDFRRDAMSVARSSLQFANFDTERYVSTATNPIKSQAFLKALLATLDSNPNEVIDALNRLRNQLTSFECFRVHVIGDFDPTDAATYTQSRDPIGPWASIFTATATAANPQLATVEAMAPATTQKMKPVTFARDLILPVVRQPQQQKVGRVCGIGSTDSGYLVAGTPALERGGFLDEDVPAMIVLIEYLTGLESVFWRRLRGLGLAYGYSIYADPEQCMLYLVLTDCGSVVRAFAQAAAIIAAFDDPQHALQSSQSPAAQQQQQEQDEDAGDEDEGEGDDDDEAEFEDFDADKVDAAKSAVVSEIVSVEETVQSAAHVSLRRYLRGMPLDTTTTGVIERIWRVDIDDLRRVLRTYITRLFDPIHSSIAVACNPGKVDDVISGFAEMGHKLERLADIDAHFV